MFRPLHMILFLLAMIWLIVCTVLSGQFTDIPWVQSLGWGGFASFLLLWVVINRREILTRFNQARVRYSLLQLATTIVSILLVLGFVVLSQRPTFDLVWDATSQKREHLTDRSLQVIEELKSRGLSVSVRAWLAHSNHEDQVRDLLRRYQRYGADLQYKVLDPQIQAVLAKSDGITEEAVLILETSEEPKRLRKVWNFNEQSMTKAMRELLNQEQKTIWFVQGHGEPGPDHSGPEGVSKLVKLLKDAGIRSDSLNLPEIAGIPEGVTNLLMVNPEYNLSVVEIKLLKQFLRRGGTLAVFMGAMRPADSLNTLLGDFGLRFEDNFVVLPPEDSRIKILGQNTAIGSEFTRYHPLTHMFAERSGFSLYLSDTRGTSLVGESLNGRAVTDALLKTSGDNIAISDVYQEDDLKNIGASRVSKGPFTVMAVAHMSEADQTESPGRILAGGFASALLNHSLHKNGHSEFAQSLAGYITDDTTLMVAGEDQRKIETGLQISKASSVWLLFGLSFAYPSFMLAGGFMIWRRRKKQ